MKFKKILYHLFIGQFINFYEAFKISFREAKKYLKEKTCSHSFMYWKGELECEDDKTIDGTVFPNMFRKCDKCGLKQRKDMTPAFHGYKRKYWHRSDKKFPMNSNTIKLKVTVWGSHKTSPEEMKRRNRNNKINKVLK